jgi:NADH-quinone oxidoreductase subunit C
VGLTPAEPPLPDFIRLFQAVCSDLAMEASFWVGDWTILVPPERLLDAARHLRSEPQALFDFCSDVTATDWPLRPARFDVIVSLYSTRHRHRVRLKAHVAEGQPIPSMTPIWPAANWLEREVFDMFGIVFDGHPDLRRILMPDEWQGHPHRKDYPLEGPGELLLENPMDWLRLRGDS